jgi:hypothetical protein
MMSPSTSESASTASKTKVLICPYCGDTQPATERCRACGGLFEPLSRQASHNAMGPWFVREERRPFQPGASYETIVKLVERGMIDRYSILRGPTTRQFWTVARRVPGIAHLLGYCHNCDATVGKDDHGCPVCGVPFGAYLDRNYLGLPEVKPLPWEAPAIDEGKARGGAQPAFTPLPGAAAGAGIDFRRAAEPLGLSSFASDAELRGMAARSPYAPQASVGTPESMSGAELVEPGASASMSHVYSGNGGGGPAGVGSAAHEAHAESALRASSRGAILDTPAGEVAARSLQRRLHRQQNTIRLLMALMGLVTVASIVVIVVMIVRLGRMNDAQPASQGGQTAPVGSGGAAAAEGASAPAASSSRRGSAGSETSSSVESAAPIEASAPPATATPATQSGAESPAPASIDGTTGTIEDDHERAIALLVEAKKEDRELKARISDCEQSVALLKGIKARASADERPEGLDEQIIEAEQLLERLKLQQFFP